MQMSDSQAMGAKEVNAHDNARETNKFGARSVTWS
jgi:hypothetical protein